MENMRGQKGDKIQKSVFYALQVYTIFFKTPKEKCLIILKHTDESILTTFNAKFTSGRNVWGNQALKNASCVKKGHGWLGVFIFYSEWWGDMKNPILQLSNIGQTEHINDLCKFNEEEPNVPFRSLSI